MDSVIVTPGVAFVRIPEKNLFFLCGSPPDVVKHLMRRGIIAERQVGGVTFETGPTALLLSDLPVQNGGFSNLAEFPLLQMFYRQGLILPGHPNNSGYRPLVVGHPRSLAAVSEALSRGTYGLANRKEILDTGATEAFADEVLREKLWFSFGSMRNSDDLIDRQPLEAEPLELRPGLQLVREGVNQFVFVLGDQRCEVDLNLAAGQAYEPPFRLGRSHIRREYFSVVHLGEGDGWDTNRPCMGSLLQFQGKNYLIDAGPNILESMEAIGVGLTEIEGVFQTHAHDDHFAGLPSLAMSDHRLKFFSTALVRSSVMKKMAALLGVPERTFANTFEYHELQFDEWNNVAGLMVRPTWSPHPVETNIYTFRAPSVDGLKTYSHWADIASFEVLRKLMLTAPSANEASRARYADLVRVLLEPADLKKVDIGGGMIHGCAEDFVPDESATLVLAHVNRPGTAREKEIGTFVDFGVQHVLVPARVDYRQVSVKAALETYFPLAPAWELDLLLNCPFRELSPGSILQKRGELFGRVLLVVGGVVEAVDGETGRESRYSAGTLIGELHVLTGRLSTQTWRARSFVTVLEIPNLLFNIFIRKNLDLEEQLRVAQTTLTLQATALFGDAVSSVHLTRIARQARALEVDEGLSPWDVAAESEPFLFLVEDGALSMMFEGHIVDSVGAGSFCGEESLFYRGSGNMLVKALVKTRGLRLPADLLLSIPILRWKLLETYERRLAAFSQLLTGA